MSDRKGADWKEKAELKESLKEGSILKNNNSGSGQLMMHSRLIISLSNITDLISSVIRGAMVLAVEGGN